MRMAVQLSGATRKRLSEMGAQVASTAEPMRVIARDLFRSVRRNFQAQGRKEEATGLWPAWSPSTVARKTYEHRGRTQILDDTGKLKRSCQPSSGTRWAAVGTNLPYASDHQQGGRWGARKRIHRLVRIPAHTQRRVVSQDYTPGHADAAHHFAKSGAFDLAARHVLRRKAKKAKARKLAFQKPKQRHDKRQLKRHGQKLARVPVRAHTQLQNYLLPARPFLWIHREDVARARQRLATWVRATRASAAAAGNRRAG